MEYGTCEYVVVVEQNAPAFSTIIEYCELGPRIFRLEHLLNGMEELSNEQNFFSGTEH